MKKNLLTLASLLAAASSQAQFLSYVGDGALVTVQADALVYNGGGMQIVGSGVVDNSGNVMLVGPTSGTAAQYQTTTTGGIPKTDGGNFILRLIDPANHATSHYGQLYIENLLQSDITGIVDKQYRATKNGTMQQMAVPFYNKTYASLGTDLGNTAGFSASARNTNAIGYWEDRRAVMHNISSSLTTLGKATLDTQTTLFNNAARYYAIGTANWDPANPAGGVYTVKGVPYSANPGSQASPASLSYTLANAGYISAGSPIAYGVGTGAINNGIYNERYSTYLQDAFDAPSQGFFNATAGSENGTFGRNMYQFGNPFLTNLDVSKIGYNEGTNGDGNAITSIQGIRYESIGVTTSNTNGTHATQYKFITFNTDGTPAGDITNTYIKPMGAFVVKLRNNTASQTLNFNTLRRFAYSPRAASTAYDVTAARPGALTGKATGSLKQLGVIGLNSDGEEVARTYYVVNSSARTGHDVDAKLQVSAFSGALSTREELPTGGEDTAYSNIYWLYINEANQSDFHGKKIRMVKGNTSGITQYKFELAENAEFLNSGQSAFTDGGESFYIEQTPGNYVKISNNETVAATSADAGLYFGQPGTGTLAADDVTVKGDNLVVAYEKNTDAYYVIFPKTWANNAKVTVYDMAGRTVATDNKVSTSSNYRLPITERAGYVIEIVSDKGERVSKKIVK